MGSGRSEKPEERGPTRPCRRLPQIEEEVAMLTVQKVMAMVSGR